MSALITAAPGTPHGPKLCLSVFQITGHLSEEPGEHLRLHAARPLFVDAFVKRAKNTRQGLNAPSHAFFFFFLGAWDYTFLYHSQEEPTNI